MNTPWDNPHGISIDRPRVQAVRDFVLHVVKHKRLHPRDKPPGFMRYIKKGSCAF
jgi:hypothetical protein